jgi:O-antigen/teichoic acid export membrane protein
MLFVAVSLGLIGVLIALIAGQEILALLYGPEYAVYWDVFLWLMVAAAINYIGAILGVGMTAASTLVFRCLCTSQLYAPALRLACG